MNTQGQGAYGAELDEEWRRTLSSEQLGQLQQLKLETERAAEYAVKRAMEDTEALLKAGGGASVASSNLPIPMQAIDALEHREQEKQRMNPTAAPVTSHR